jgi:hypothetical protein
LRRYVVHRISADKHWHFACTGSPALEVSMSWKLSLCMLALTGLAGCATTSDPYYPATSVRTDAPQIDNADAAGPASVPGAHTGAAPAVIVPAPPAASPVIIVPPAEPAQPAVVVPPAQPR